MPSPLLGRISWKKVSSCITLEQQNLDSRCIRDGVYGAGDLMYTFWKAGDVYVTADWNGNGTTRIGVLSDLIPPGCWTHPVTVSGGRETTSTHSGKPGMCT